MAKTNAQMRQLAEEYFADAKNQPYSIAALSLILEIDLKELKEWIGGKKGKEKQKLAWFIRYSALAGWERGEKNGGVPNTMVPWLLDRYFEDEKEVRTDEDNNIRVTLFEEGVKDGV